MCEQEIACGVAIGSERMTELVRLEERSVPTDEPRHAMHGIREDGKLPRLVGMPLKILAWRMCNYCPELPKLDWNVVVFQK